MATYKIKGIKDVKLLYLDSGDAIAEQDIPFGNAFSMELETEEMEFEGDGQTETVYSNQKLTGTCGFDKFSEDVLSNLFGKTAVTSGLDVGEAKRYYMGNDAEMALPNVGFKVDLYALDDSDGAEANIRVTIFKAQVSPFTPPEAQNAEKWAPYEVNWSAIKTAADLAGAALPSAPSGGALYAISILS